MADGPKGVAGFAVSFRAVADIAPHGMRCALYGKLLKRTAMSVRLLALERRRGGVFRPIHPMDFDFHPMDRPFHPMEISFHGLFSAENSLRFAPYSGENGVLRVFYKRAFHGYSSLPSISDFRSNACD